LLNVLIIGCGNIAGRFDESAPSDRLPLTHAGAFRAHGGYKMVACVEPDRQRRAEFMQHWSIAEGHDNVALLKDRVGAFDIVSICSPTALHASHLGAAIELRPRLIFCEKPVTPSVRESEYWNQKCEEAGILLAVNHTRRWAPDVQRLAVELRDGKWGALRAVVGHYNKGAMNNGGHMIDLLRLLVGELNIVSVGAPSWDFWQDDPTVPANLLSDSGVPVYLNATHAGDFSFFELELFTSEAVLAMEGGGAQWRIRRAEPSATFKGYKSLGNSQSQAGEYSQAMTNAAANIEAAVLRGEALASTGESALRAQRVCERMRTEALAQQSSSVTSGNRT
jgi:predicted dehydrogenase